MRPSPPGPRGEPLFGNSRQYATDPFTFLTDVADAYDGADVIEVGFGPLDVYILTEPALVEQVLVGESAKYTKPDLDAAMNDLLGDGLLLSDGQQWRKQRRLATPAFHARRVGTLADRMVAQTAATVEGWSDGETIDVQLEIARLTIRIIVTAMLGVEPTDEQVRTVQANLDPLGARFEPDPIRFLLPDWAPTAENRRFDDAVGAMESVIDELVEQRRGTQYDPAADPGGTADDEGQPMDLLSILLRASDRGEQTARELRDEMMTMLLAGHDTTALTLTYTYYLLSQHPEAEARVHAEVRDVLGDGSAGTDASDTAAGGDGQSIRTPTMRDVRGLEYTGRVLNEAMRLYPPVYTLFREPKVDVRLGDYRVPAGSVLMLPQWVIHRSPRYWDEPETFDPDRFAPGRSRDRHRFAFFPFGGGPRMCIGKQFSMLEAKVILATVARDYRLEYARDEPFDLRGSLTMHPEQPMLMRLRSVDRT
jgi:cytochrome P450